MHKCIVCVCIVAYTMHTTVAPVWGRACRTMLIDLDYSIPDYSDPECVQAPSMPCSRAATLAALLLSSRFNYRYFLNILCSWPSGGFSRMFKQRQRKDTQHVFTSPLWYQ